MTQHRSTAAIRRDKIEKALTEMGRCYQFSDTIHGGDEALTKATKHATVAISMAIPEILRRLELIERNTKHLETSDVVFVPDDNPPRNEDLATTKVELRPPGCRTNPDSTEESF